MINIKTLCACARLHPCVYTNYCFITLTLIYTTVIPSTQPEMRWVSRFNKRKRERAFTALSQHIYSANEHRKNKKQQNRTLTDNKSLSSNAVFSILTT